MNIITKTVLLLLLFTCAAFAQSGSVTFSYEVRWNVCDHTNHHSPPSTARMAWDSWPHTWTTNNPWFDRIWTPVGFPSGWNTIDSGSLTSSGTNTVYYGNFGFSYVEWPPECIPHRVSMASRNIANFSGGGWALPANITNSSLFSSGGQERKANHFLYWYVGVNDGTSSGEGERILWRTEEVQMMIDDAMNWQIPAELRFVQPQFPYSWQRGQFPYDYQLKSAPHPPGQPWYAPYSTLTVYTNSDAATTNWGFAELIEVDMYGEFDYTSTNHLLPADKFFFKIVSTNAP